MKKRVLSLILAAVMVCALLPTAALAADSDFVIEDGALTKYNGPGGDVVIPDSVTSIGLEAFYKCTSLTSVTIPDSVTEIGGRAFCACYNLTSVTIPDSVTSIGKQAFYSCYNLTSVTIPDSVTEIEVMAFEGCVTLTSVVIPNSVTEIGEGAFLNCFGLTSVTIPDSVTTIGTSAFSGCTSLTSVTIPDSVTSIASSAFDYCTSLTSVTIPDSVTSIASSAFDECTSLTSVTIPDSVTSIGNYAFNCCESLTSVTIPNSVTSIGYFAFNNCTSLTDVYYGGTEAQWSDMDIIDINNDPLSSATIHYNNTMPAVTPGANLAYPSTQTVDVDGRAIEFQCYALKDENGNDTNYIKLRDLAILLNGTEARFEVDWNGEVTITTKKAYTPNGSELSTPFSGQRAYEKSGSATLVDGVAAELDAIVLTDDNGGGYTYYKLRDLGGALGFKVDWSAQRGIYIETK